MAKRKNIKVLFCDVDGTLTDGLLYFGPNGEALKVFNVKDGHGIKDWMNSGRVFVILTARDSDATKARCKELGVSEVFCNVSNKRAFMEHWLRDHGFHLKQCAYIGDDINDLEAMASTHIAACPSDALEVVKKKADFICKLPGGRAAVREFIDYLLKR